MSTDSSLVNKPAGVRQHRETKESKMELGLTCVQCVVNGSVLGTSIAIISIPLALKSAFGFKHEGLDVVTWCHSRLRSAKSAGVPHSSFRSRVVVKVPRRLHTPRRNSHIIFENSNLTDGSRDTKLDSMISSKMHIAAMEWKHFGTGGTSDHRTIPSCSCRACQ